MEPLTFFNDTGILQLLWNVALGRVISYFVHTKVTEWGGNDKCISLRLEELSNPIIVVSQHITKGISITWNTKF